MATCSACSCKNYKRKHKELTFFTLPKDKSKAREWLAKMKREDLPIVVYLCEQHFEETQFDESVDLYNRLLPPGNKKRPRKLKEDAVPTIFEHIPQVEKRVGVKERVEKRKIIQELLDQYNDSLSKSTQTESSTVDASVQANIPTPQPKTKVKRTQVTPDCKDVSVDCHLPVTVDDQIDVHIRSLTELLGLPSLPNIIRDIYSQANKTESDGDDGDDNEHDYAQNYAPVKSFTETGVNTSFIEFGTTNELLRPTTTSSFISTIDKLQDDQPCHESSFIETSTGPQAVDSDCSVDDEWLQKSLKRSEKSDLDYDITPDLNNIEEQISIKVPKKFNFAKDRSFLVYESQLNILLEKCVNCGKPVIQKREMKSDGCQYRLKMECLDGCETTWCSQPALSTVNGAGNLMVTAAADMVGISFPKLKRFATILNLKMFESDTFFRLRGAYAVDRETDGRLTIKRKFVRPDERPTREETIEKPTKYSRMK